MKDTLTDIRDEKGTLPAYAWPGGYPLFYITKDGMCICPKCANLETDAAQTPIAFEVNWEDPALYCDDCGKRIESAYAEDENEDTE